MRRVVDLVEQLGAAKGVSVDDLLPLCPGHTREQVMQALHNAKNRKRIEARLQGMHRGIGLGSTPSTYGPYHATPAPPPPEPDPTPARGQLGHLGRLASVWDMAAAAGRSIDNNRGCA